MISSLKSTSYQVVLYSAGNLLLKFIGLLLLPLYTSVFNLSDFGVIGILETSSQILTAVLSFSLSSALVRWLSDPNRTFKEEKSIVFTVLSLSLIIISLFSLLIYPFLSFISNLLFSENTNILLILMLLGCYIDILNRIPLNLIRVREKPVLYAVSMILRSVFTLGLNIILLKYYNFGIEAVLISALIGNLVFFLTTLPLLVKNIEFSFLKNEIKPILSFSFPLIFVGFGAILLSMGDRYVLNWLKDLGQVGVYTLAYKVSGVVNLLVLQAFNLAVLPLALKSFHSSDGKRFLAELMKYLSLALCFLFVTISLFSEEVLRIFASSADYLQASKIIPILLLAYVFDGMRTMFGYHILFVKKTAWNAYLTLGGAVLNIVLNIMIIPVYGYIGAAFTTLISSIVLFLTYYKVAQKQIYVSYKVGRNLVLIILSVFLYVISLAFSGNFIVNIFLTIVFSVILIMYIFFKKKLCFFKNKC